MSSTTTVTHPASGPRPGVGERLRSTVGAMFVAYARVMQAPFFKEERYPYGARDRTDLSYKRS